MGNKLTPKQKLFVKEYLVDLNATQACIRAGYSAANPGKIGPELLGKTRIAEAIQKEMDKRNERVEIDQDWVISQLRGLITEALEDKQHGARVNAIKLIGQHIGMFIDRKQIDGSLDLHNGMSDAELIDKVGEILEALNAGTDEK